MKISRSQGYTRVIGPSNWKDTIVSTEMGKVVNSTVFRRRIRSSSLDIKVWNTHWTFNYKCWVGSWICKLWIWREVSDGNVYSSRCLFTFFPFYLCLSDFLKSVSIYYHPFSNISSTVDSCKAIFVSITIYIKDFGDTLKSGFLVP